MIDLVRKKHKIKLDAIGDRKSEFYICKRDVWGEQKSKEEWRREIKKNNRGQNVVRRTYQLSFKSKNGRTR